MKVVIAGTHTFTAFVIPMVVVLLVLAKPALAEPLPNVLRQLRPRQNPSSSSPQTDPSSVTDTFGTDSITFSGTSTLSPTDASTTSPTDTSSPSPTDTDVLTSGSISTDSSLILTFSNTSSVQTPTAPIPPTVIPPTIPPGTSTQHPAQTSVASHHSHSGAIEGGVIGGLVGLAILIGLIYPFLKRRLATSRRTRGVTDTGRVPPSPRLHRPWYNASPEGSAFDSLRPRRLRSLNDGEPSPGNVESGGMRDIAGAGDLRRSMNSATGGTAAMPGAVSSRHTRSSSKGTTPNDVLGATYNLEVFRNAAVNENTDPSRSQTSLHANTGDSSGVSGTDLSRNPSVNRVLRKPAPTYNEEEDAASPLKVSKPPVAGTGMGRVRSHSHASANSHQSAGSGGSPSNVSHKSSIKFYGEKEGPVHYLIPDLPSADIS